MTTKKVISLLGNIDCDICPHKVSCAAKPDVCCIVGLAIKRLEELEHEKEACFKLGQMDMRESASAKLRDVADNVYGIARATLENAANIIDSMETIK